MKGEEKDVGRSMLELRNTGRGFRERGRRR